jgi:hypothetical protein
MMDIFTNILSRNIDHQSKMGNLYNHVNFNMVCILIEGMDAGGNEQALGMG